MSADAPPPPGQSYPLAPPPARGPSGCLLALTILLALGLLLSLFLNLTLIGAKSGRGAPGTGPSRPDPLAEKWIEGEGEDKVCLVELEGVIMDEVRSQGVFGATERPVERIKRELEAAAKDDRVKAVLFSVDSPGGAVTTSDEIWHLFMDWRARTKKPVVVWMGGLCASGGYYVSMAADEVWASPTTITGSIGVIMQTFNMAGLLKRFDVESVTIKSGANKDLMNPFKPINPEHLGILGAMVDEMYAKFVGKVVLGRKSAGLSEEVVKKLADGRIYTADQALQAKLVDRVGYREEAFGAAKARAGVKEATLFRYQKAPGLLEILSGEAQARAGRAPLGLDLSLEALLSCETPRPYYLFAPGAR